MKGQIFRVAHLGYFDFPDLFGVIAELELILAAAGHSVELRPRRGGGPAGLGGGGRLTALGERSPYEVIHEDPGSR